MSLANNQNTHCVHGTSMCIGCQLCHLGGGKQVAADWPLDTDCFELWDIGPFNFVVSEDYSTDGMLQCVGRLGERQEPYKVTHKVGTRLKVVKRAAAAWAKAQFNNWAYEADRV